MKPEEAKVEEEAKADEQPKNELLGMVTNVETKTDPVTEPVKKKRGRPPKKKLVVTEDK